MKISRVTMIGLSLTALLTIPVFSQSYDIKWDSFSGGFEKMKKGNYVLTVSLGELMGKKSANNFIINSAFLSYYPIIFTDAENDEIPPPNRMELYQNYPNPFNPSTQIKFRINSLVHTIIKVFDVLGKEIAILINDVKSPGLYEAEFNGVDLSSGIYFIQLRAGDFVETKKAVLLK